MFCFKIHAQVNLVPDYSFEQYSTCPNNAPGNIQHSSYWINANVNGTSDYYNACVTNTNSYFDVPSNWCGYQNAKTGNGYAGCFVKTIPYTVAQYEYAETNLLATLKPNYHYCVQFFVSRAEKKGDYAISNFGALFTNTILNSSDQYNIQMSPQVKNQQGNFVVDRTIWAAIAGTFVALGGEQFVTIGNFDDPSLTDTLYDPVLPDDGVRDPGSIYYYIDDVTVEEVANAKAGNDKTINCGDSIVLGADSAIGAFYKWTPAIGLNNDSISFPVSNPTITTTYVLRKQQCNVITFDTIVVTVNNNCPVGINELSYHIKFSIYPNPLVDKLNIEFQIPEIHHATVFIYNLFGELVKKTDLQNGANNINVSNLSNGTYFYSLITNGSEIKRDKLMIIR